MRTAQWICLTGWLLPLGCTGMERPEEAVAISWLEARRIPGGVEVRAVGGGGCSDQIPGIDDDIVVSSDTLLVSLYPRGNRAGGDCVRPGEFDTTVVLALDSRRPMVFLTPPGPFNPSSVPRPLLHLKAAAQGEPERWLGGFVAVRSDSLGCLYMYRRRLLEYAFRPPDGITLAPGSNAYVRGLILDPADRGCAGRTLISVDSIALTRKAGATRQRGAI